MDLSVKDMARNTAGGRGAWDVWDDLLQTNLTSVASMVDTNLSLAVGGPPPAAASRPAGGEQGRGRA